MNPLSILITNIGLQRYTGTELVVRDLAFGFKKLGHYPMVYTPIAKGIAQELITAGIPVCTSLLALPRKPDVIHGHHHLQTLKAALNFPNVPVIFVCHDRLAWHDTPPQIPISRYVAVDYNCLDRLLYDYQIPAAMTKVIHNWVDTDRFQLKNKFSPTPKRALVFSNYANQNNYLPTIEAACNTLNLPLDVIGAEANNLVNCPEMFLGKYDIVFAKAKCALEAMATGAAVVLCDTRGLGGLVTTRNVALWRRWNFGMQVLTNPITKMGIIEEIQRYDADNAKKVANFIRSQAPLQSALQNYLKLYEKILNEQLKQRPLN